MTSKETLAKLGIPSDAIYLLTLFAAVMFGFILGFVIGAAADPSSLCSPYMDSIPNYRAAALFEHHNLLGV